jgi:hypothetical protein
MAKMRLKALPDFVLGGSVEVLFPVIENLRGNENGFCIFSK